MITFTMTEYEEAMQQGGAVPGAGVGGLRLHVIRVIQEGFMRSADEAMQSPEDDREELFVSEADSLEELVSAIDVWWRTKMGRFA